MTVYELIKQLEKHQPDLEVRFSVHPLMSAPITEVKEISFVGKLGVSPRLTVELGPFPKEM